MRPSTSLLMAGFVAIITATMATAQPFKSTKSPTGAPPTIPTFSTSDLSRTGIFYAGGKYVGEPGKEVMAGSAYVEVWVPKQIKHPYPIIYIHGAGQTATDWLQTPDGRPGWAYYFAKLGYVQYMVDSPARGRSPYVPDHDGNLNIRTAANLEATFTASAKKGDFPRAHLHTQFPGTGLMGDPIFDDFARTQVQFLGGGGPASQDELSRDAFVALLDMIKSPVIILSHSQGGTVGWLMADARPNQVKGIVTVEPAAPPIKGVDTAKVAYNAGGGGGGLSWGVTSNPITYDPPIKSPSELQVAAGREVGHSRRRGSVLRPEGTRAKTGESRKNSGGVFVLRGRLSSRVRPLPGEVAESGGREDSVRAHGGRRPSRQRPRNDAREEQRRHRQVHRRVDGEEYSAEGQSEYGHASVVHPDIFHREHCSPRIPVRGWQVCRRTRQRGHGRDDVHGGMGAEAATASLSSGVLPWQRTDRRGLAADAGRAARMGILSGGSRLHGLHGRLSGARPFTLCSRSRRQAWDPHGPSTGADLDWAGARRAAIFRA